MQEMLNWFVFWSFANPFMKTNGFVKSWESQHSFEHINSEKPAILIQKHVLIKTNNSTLGNVSTIQINVPLIQIDTTAEKPWNTEGLRVLTKDRIIIGTYYYERLANFNTNEFCPDLRVYHAFWIVLHEQNSILYFSFFSFLLFLLRHTRRLSYSTASIIDF